MTDIITPIKQTSRFKEHFDILLPTTTLQNVLDIEEDSILANDKPRSMSISPLSNKTPLFSKPPPLRMHSSPDMLTLKTNNSNNNNNNNINNNQSTITLSHQPSNINMNNQHHNDQQEQEKENQIHSSSTPKVPLPTTPKKPINVAAVQYKGYISSNGNSNSLNRADIMIKRLSNWVVILKLTSGWLDEIEKWTSSTTFKKQKKENPDLYGNINKRRKEYHHTVSNFKKECRDKIHQLKVNTSLQMEELLLRANETKKCMDHLSHLCKYAEDTSKPRLPEMDPWLGNLHVLRYLKRETTEENRLRELMVPIQKDIKELETKINENLKTIIHFCAEYQTTVTQYGNTYDQILQQLLPQPTWPSFVEAQQKDWVDENHIQKNYLHINYPNKSSPYVATVQKGLLGRRSGVLKHYHKRFYVLTHYGYLHQFKLDDKVKPESSIFITSTTIQPPVNDSDIIFSDDIDSNIQGFQQQNKNNPHNPDANENNDSSSQQNENKHGYIFEIHRKSKLYYFKTKTSHELVAWCKALNNVAKEISVQKLLEQRRQKQLLKEQHLLPTTTPSLHSTHQKHHKDIILDDTLDADDDDESEFHSIHSDGEDSSMNNTALIESDIISLDIGAGSYPNHHHHLNGSSSNFSNNDSSTTSHSSPSPFVTTTTTTTTMANIQSTTCHPPVIDESAQLIPPKVDIDKEGSAIYFSSTSSPSSSSTTHSPQFTFPPPPPPLPTSSLSNTTRRGVATYQANLNLDL
ncbi:unnamed protein product [Cunninghamella blakesleeana]